MITMPTMIDARKLEEAVLEADEDVICDECAAEIVDMIHKMQICDSTIHSYWIISNGFLVGGKCGNCGEGSIWGGGKTYVFCPYCSARMEYMLTGGKKIEVY